MNPNRPAVDAKLALVSFHPAPEPHITVDHQRCARCGVDRVCIDVCPAQNYVWDPGAQRMAVSTTSCFECGSCRIACTEDAIAWKWPAGGFGVGYAHG